MSRLPQWSHETGRTPLAPSHGPWNSSPLEFFEILCEWLCPPLFLMQLPKSLSRWIALATEVNLGMFAAHSSETVLVTFWQTDRRCCCVFCALFFYFLPEAKTFWKIYILKMHVIGVFFCTFPTTFNCSACLTVTLFYPFLNRFSWNFIL